MSRLLSDSAQWIPQEVFPISIESPAGRECWYRMEANPFSISDSVMFVSDSGGSLMVKQR